MATARPAWTGCLTIQHRAVSVQGDTELQSFLTRLSNSTARSFLKGFPGPANVANYKDVARILTQVGSGQQARKEEGEEGGGRGMRPEVVLQHALPPGPLEELPS